MATFIPSWNNIQYTAQTGSFRFLLRATFYNGSTTTVYDYEGLAYPYPDGVVKLDISELYRNYLMISDGIPKGSGDTPYRAAQPNGYAKCELFELNEDNEENSLDSWYIQNEGCDYKTNIITEDVYLSEPINGRADPRMNIYATQCKPLNGGTVTPL